MEKAGPLLSPLLKRLGIADDVRLQRLRNDWHNLFEKPLSQHMSPSRLFEGDLLLYVDSPAWMQQLGFCKKEILKKLSAYGVKDIRFRIGKVLLKDSQRFPGRKSAELSPEDTLFIADVVSDVGDETLRETIRKSIEKSLLWAKPRNQLE